jgi:hypothetical protein
MKIEVKELSIMNFLLRHVRQSVWHFTPYISPPDWLVTLVIPLILLRTFT